MMPPSKEIKKQGQADNKLQWARGVLAFDQLLFMYSIIVTTEIWGYALNFALKRIVPAFCLA